MAEQKSNPVWQHFTEPTPGKARCNICNGPVSLGAEKGKKKNTTNLWSHLRCHHLQAYKDAQKEKEEAAASTANVSQPTLTEKFDAQRKWQNSDPRSKNCHRQSAIYICLRYWFSEAGGCNGAQIQPKN